MEKRRSTHVGGATVPETFPTIFPNISTLEISAGKKLECSASMVHIISVEKSPATKIWDTAFGILETIPITTKFSSIKTMLQSLRSAWKNTKKYKVATMSKICPINWKSEDGPYPCPFRHDSDKCSYNHVGIGMDYYKKMCTPQYVERFIHDSREITVRCDKCGKSVKTTVGESERYNGTSVEVVEQLCYGCADEKFGWSLAAHIRGE